MDKDIVKRVSAGGVVYHKGKYLVIKWGSEKTTELPKGTIELGENPEQACVRELKEETGYTIASYITSKRLLLARDLMEKQTSITEVCYACGFKNYSSFSRAYKKCFQNTPRSYLNENI